MRYNPPLAALALALLATATVKAQDNDAATNSRFATVFRSHSSLVGPNLCQNCSNLCKTSQCIETCSRCEYAVNKGWLATDAHSAPPSCQSRCGKDKYCLFSCQAYQNSCCTPPFGCCPYDARLCVCKPDSGVGC
ncbi:hypothetical protein V8E36_008881 [Tilletia maclaganii]